MHSTAMAIVGGLMMAIATFALGYTVHRAVFEEVLLSYGLFFVGFALWCWKVGASGRWFWMGLGLAFLLRLLLLGATPLLSEDIYRFLWDGFMANHGVHPFANTPQQIIDRLGYMNDQEEVNNLFHHLNSKDYYTVYPPVGQWIFRAADSMGGHQLAYSIPILKVFLLLGEIATVWAIYSAVRILSPGKERMATLLYALHPLIIVEVMGNGHFEGMMCGALMASFWALHQRKWAMAGLLWSVAVGIKLLPLLFLPIVLPWIWGNGQRAATLRFLGAFTLASALMFWSLLDIQVLQNMSKSIGLYLQKFEFNGSLYYILAKPSPLFTGWYEGQIINGFLSGVRVLFIVLSGWAQYRSRLFSLKSLQNALYWAAIVYLIGSATVHPWYVLVPLVLGLGTSWRAALAWSLMVVVSYSHYIGGGLQERFEWIFLEYLVVFGVVIWEMRERQRMT